MSTSNPDVAQPQTNNTARLLFVSALVLFPIFLCWLYYPALNSYFSNDDWVILYHTYSIPPIQVWRYFNMHTIWFYRPLQSMQFAWTAHLFGFNYAYFSGQLILMHLIVCGLYGLLIRRMFGVPIAVLATILFSVSCLSPDILLWAGNFNTMQYAITTLAAALLFVKYLDTNNRKWLIALIGVTILNCFTKESCLNLPLILGAVWLTIELQKRWTDQDSRDYPKLLSIPAVVQISKILAPVIGITVLYAVVHLLFYENTEKRYLLEYHFVSPLTALGQWSHTINMSLFGYLSFPLTYAQKASWARGIENVLQYGYIIAPALLVIGFWLKRPFVIFAVLFAGFLQFPTFALDRYNANRYYYLATGGGVLLAGGLLWPAINGFIRQVWNQRTETVGQEAENNVCSRYFGYGAIIIFLTIFALNVVIFQTIIGGKGEQAFFMEQTFQYLQKNGERLPKKSLIIFRMQPNTMLHNGLGATEMVRLATNRRDIMAISNDYDFPEVMRKQLDNIPNQYLIDVYAPETRLVWVKGKTL